MNKKSADLIIYNIKQLLTISDEELGIVEQAGIAIRSGIIIAVGDSSTLLEQYNATKTVDATGKTVTPGLIDCHTHLVFAGSREDEMVQRLKGADYLKILTQGGGILSTVSQTRATNIQDILQNSKKWLDYMLNLGVTTVEIKSGYGLDYDNEFKLLTVIAKLRHLTDQLIVPTFLAHTFPPKIVHEKYIEQLINEMLPSFKQQNLAEAFDIFIEREVFSAEQADAILYHANNLGYKIKMHVNQISSIGGMKLAVKYNAVSVDHLDNVSDNELAILAETKTVATLLPGASYFLNLSSIPPVQNILQYNIPVAIATNFNPGSCPSPNIHLMMSLAVHRFGMNVKDVWRSVTINAAKALGKDSEIGSIEVGKKAHILLWDMANYNMVFYHFGYNLVSSIIIGSVIRNIR
jgi:imidazolonepropionase